MVMHSQQFQLRDYLNCGRSSILEANKRLVEVGLIKVDKHKNNNNIYLPMQPLSKSELTSQVPTKVRELEMRQAEISKATENDRMRFGGLLLKQSNKISD